MKCVDCTHRRFCAEKARILGQVFDQNYDGERGCSDFSVFTNADRIRAMNDEELAKWMSGGALHSDSVCSYCDRNKMGLCDGVECSNKTDAEIILDWLKQTVKDGEGDGV